MKKIRFEKTNRVENLGLFIYLLGIAVIVFSMYSQEIIVYFSGIFVGITGLVIFKAGGTKYVTEILE